MHVIGCMYILLFIWTFSSLLSFSFCHSHLFAYLEASQFLCLSLLSLVFCRVDKCSAAMYSVSGVPQPRIHLSEQHLRELILNQNSHALMQLGEANSVCIMAQHCMNDFA